MNPETSQYANLPAALHNTLQKDKKPFTYTPGGIDFSELRSPRMQRRIDKNARQVSPPPMMTSPQPAQNQHSPPMASTAPTFAQTPVRLPFPNAQPLPKIPSPGAPTSPGTVGGSSPKPHSPRVQIIGPSKYNSPIQLYSKENASDAYHNQVDDLASQMKG